MDDLERALSKLAESTLDRERLSRELADLRTAAGQLGDVTKERDALKSQVGDLTGQLDAALKGVTEITSARDTAASQIAALVGKYREQAIAADPSLAPLAETITGGTTEEIDAAVVRAKELVAKVAETVKASGQGRPVPSGGNERQPLDTSAMSASEMIRAGVAEAQAKAGGR